MLKEILKDAQGVPTGNYKDIAGGTFYADSPIGSILPYGGATAPAGWLICNGASLLRTDYAELFAVIGTAFGSADSTHFNIPDMRESVPKGAGETGQTVGAHVKSGGLAVGEFLDDRIQNITGQVNYHNGETRTPVASASGVFVATNVAPQYAYIEPNPNSTSIGGVTFNASRVARTGATTEVKSVGVNYIIKAKMVTLPADLASGVEEIVDEALADTEWVTVNSYVKARRVGKTVSLALTYDKSVINASNWTKVADLDARFYPSKQTIGCSYWLSGGTTYHADYFISPTGAVNLLGNMDLETTVVYIAD